MNPINGKKELSSRDMDLLDNQAQSTLIEELISKLGTSSIETLKQGGLTENQMASLQGSLEQMAAKAERLFGRTGQISDLKVQEFIKTEFICLISSVEETMKNQAPDLIREAGLSEAVFSHKGDYHPILATDSLATCIGVGGFDPLNNFGFVIHFTGEDEVEASGPMLLDRLRAYREQNPKAPLLIHLRGGIKGMSEPLLTKVKDWLSSSDLNVIIASEETLQSPIYPGIGIPKVPGSIKLDVRTGTCVPYDPLTNPYSKGKKKNVSDLNTNMMTEIFDQVATKKPEIKIVYDSKA